MKVRSTPHDRMLPAALIERRILLVRGHKVMLDRDLAELYGVTTKRLNEQVRRNRDRFPADFMLRLTREETLFLARSRSQNATLKRGQNIKHVPSAFTEHGAVMLASVLNSPVAVRASIHVVRAFVRLREILATHRDLARKLEELEQKYDAQFKGVFDALRELMAPPEPPRRQIGFHAKG